MLDVRVLAEWGVRSVSVVAGVSAQDARGVHAAKAVDPDLIEAQLIALQDAEIAAYRIGALLDERSARCIARVLGTRRRPVVYDPVASAGAGGIFADSVTLRCIAEALFPVTTVFMPNLVEAGMLLGRPIASVDEMELAARALGARGVPTVLLKGGHLAGDPRDVLFTAGKIHTFADERLPGEMRGTGCVLAASLAAALAQEVCLFDAVRRARTFVRKKIASAHVFAGMRSAY
jgi:hydroxymethylpyrimidine/phosphomethylpyrimidine kinase